MPSPVSTYTPLQAQLLGWLQAAIPAPAYDWLIQHLDSGTASRSLKDFYLAFGQTPRRVGKQPLHLTEADLHAAQQLRKGFTPTHWTTDQTARTLLLLSLPDTHADTYLHTLEQLFTTAEVGEWVALYQALPLLSHPEKLVRRAAEGIRMSIDVVFNAIALDNPYPMDYLSEEAWNQMVLKAVFTGSPLHRIQGIEHRANTILARTLTQYAHERWAAGRPITPLLWQQVAPFVSDKNLPDLHRLLTAPGTESDQQAAVLACLQSPYEPAHHLAQTHRPDLVTKVQNGTLTWDTLT